MNQDSSSAEELLLPGNIISFGDITELAAFEEVLAHVVNPEHDVNLWAARIALRDLIRPPKFNGTIGNINLTVIENPYDRLLDAVDRGWRVGRGVAQRALSTEKSRQLIARFHGFGFTADAMSSGRGITGQIQTELWYYPLIPKVVPAGTKLRGYNITSSGEKKEFIYTSKKDLLSHANVDNLGKTINRVVAKPKYEKEKFIKLNEGSRRIGFELLQQAMMSPRVQPMRD